MQICRKYIFLCWFTGSVLFLLSGCLREDRSECEQDLTLKFRYAGSLGNEQAGVPEIDHLSVFVFGGDGKFVKHFNDRAIHIDDSYSMALALPSGDYRFVVWAGLDENYLLPDCVAGETDIHDLILRIDRKSDNTVPELPSLLYHGVCEPVNFQSMEGKTVIVDLWRVTNAIRVITYHLNPDSDHAISIEADNGSYYYNREIAPDSLLIYMPIYAVSRAQASPLIADFNVMRLEPGRNARLKIKDGTGATQYDVGLIDKLIGLNPRVNFEYDHDFVIEISFDGGYIPVCIKINGWEIIEEGDGLAQLCSDKKTPFGYIFRRE